MNKKSILFLLLPLLFLIFFNLSCISIFPSHSFLLRKEKVENPFEYRNPPVAAWHRGNINQAQEDSLKSIRDALASPIPNFEIDIMDFTDEHKMRIGLVSHDYTLKRATGLKGKFNQYHNIQKIPLNRADPKKEGVPFISIIELFEEIKKSKQRGITPFVSLDMKEEGKTGYEFGVWIGHLIKEYGFEKHVFASSFFYSNVKGVKDGCAECMIGGLVYQKHPFLYWLSPHYTTLDIMRMFRKKLQIDFVLIHDEILFDSPELADYWKQSRGVKFVGIFTDRTTPYNSEEMEKLKKIEWMELNSAQMEQFLKIKKTPLLRNPSQIQ